MTSTTTHSHLSSRNVTILQFSLSIAALLLGVIGTVGAIMIRVELSSDDFSRDLIAGDTIGTRHLILFNEDYQRVAEWKGNADGAELFLNDSAENNRIVLSSSNSDANVVLINENGHLAAVMLADKEGRGKVYTMRADGETATRIGVDSSGQGEYAASNANGELVRVMVDPVTEVSDVTPSTKVSVND